MQTLLRCILAACSLGACATEPSAIDKCDNLVDVLCDRGVQCLGGSHTECIQAFNNELPCGSAKAVSASYDRCLSQIEGNSCSVLFPVDPSNGQRVLQLPADCNEVILVREAPAPPPAGAPVGEISVLADAP